MTRHREAVQIRLNIADRLLIQRDRSLESLDRVSRLNLRTDETVVIERWGATGSEEIEIRTERWTWSSRDTTGSGRLGKYRPGEEQNTAKRRDKSQTHDSLLRESRIKSRYQYLTSDQAARTTECHHQGLLLLLPLPLLLF
jgi:hypothetical protein